MSTIFSNDNNLKQTDSAKSRVYTPNLLQITVLMRLVSETAADVPDRWWRRPEMASFQK